MDDYLLSSVTRRFLGSPEGSEIALSRIISHRSAEAVEKVNHPTDVTIAPYEYRY